MNIKIIVIFIISTSYLSAFELKIVPLKKPVLDKEIKEKKLSENIIKPKSKPKKIEAGEVKSVEIIKKEKKITGLILPKNKPLVVKKQRTLTKDKSKYFNKKDFERAKKAIRAMEKGQWLDALSIAKKSKEANTP